jgi:pyruvate dehydrogenase E2 component (dihydrolipoamide acetyltransferase)
VPASPLARRKAHELGLDLATILGTGSGGAVTMADVEAAAGATRPAAPAPEATPEPIPAPAPARPAPPARPGMHQAAMREAIAALMARSKKEIPHYYLQATIDMERSLGWLERVNTERSVADRILPAAMLLKATAVSVHEVPEMNGFLVDGVFTPSPQVHLGVAVSLRGGGLIAPALHEVDTLPLDTLMAALKDLGGRARGGKLRSSEMSDPTLTVTNLGDQGVDLVHGVIYPPQVALVGFGRIHQLPVAIDGMLAVHRCVIVTLAADHRVSDGHRGGLFLAAIDAALQKPEVL